VDKSLREEMTSEPEIESSVVKMLIHLLKFELTAFIDNIDKHGLCKDSHWTHHEVEDSDCQGQDPRQRRHPS
jgi:hypothetical protein